MGEGYIYLVAFPNENATLHKIGKTGNLARRLDQLSREHGMEARLVASVLVDDMNVAELWMHYWFMEQRRTHELFRMSERDIDIWWQFARQFSQRGTRYIAQLLTDSKDEADACGVALAGAALLGWFNQS